MALWNGFAAEPAWGPSRVETEDAVTIAIRDDGSGFDPELHSEGFGLLGMHERADLVGGTISIDSALGGGTTVRARVPARHREQSPAGPAQPAQPPRSAAG